MPYTLPPLRFGYDALEPHIPAGVLRRHHRVHHQAYVDGINAVLRAHPALDGLSIEALLRRLPDLPEPIQGEVRRQGGGHANHQFQWKVIGPAGTGAAHGTLASEIEQGFGSFAGFRSRFIAAAMAQAGPGWAFLSLHHPIDGGLEILTLPENESVLPRAKPGILICDLWDHAHDGARREDYLQAFFRIIDWQVCEERLIGLRAGRQHL